MIKFWPSSAPEKGVYAAGRKLLAPPYTASAQCLRLSERFFFIKLRVTNVLIIIIIIGRVEPPPPTPRQIGPCRDFRTCGMKTILSLLKVWSLSLSLCMGSVVVNINWMFLRNLQKKHALIEDCNEVIMIIMIMTSGWGLQQKPTSPITKKYTTLKIKIDNEAVQKLHTS